MAKYLTIRAAMERLSVSRTFLYGLIEVGLLERSYLNSAPAADGTARRPIPRISLASIERYERGEAVTTSTRSGTVKERTIKARPTRQLATVHFR
jgi:hypothetical protein